VETIAGSGRGVPAQGEKGKRALEASFCEPTGIAVAPDGQIFVADTGNHVIRVLEP
jgi:streptogramin lyase